ncbi:MAG: Lrp/AsnC family transcriptional regulator [Nanoarchaeota archaeon]|nr:Lrp/AsnC family transcriptional regulator [Nanoarchaeota archaeon]
MFGKQHFSKKELLLISNLRKSGRSTLTELSAKTDIPISTIHEKLKHQKLIRRHTCILDFNMLGYSTVANILLRVKKGEKDNLQNYLLKHFNVNSLYKVNSGYDYMVEGIFKNIKEIEEFLEIIDDKFRIRSKQVYYIIDELAKERFLSEAEHVNGIV